MTETKDQADTINLPRVAHVKSEYGSSYEVIINRGRTDGVKVGHRFLIYGLGEEILDPISGTSLGQLELIRGQGAVIHVQEKLSILKSTETRTEPQTKRYVKETSPFITLGSRTTSEEIIPGKTEEIPFDNPKVGDFAKPI